MSWQYLDLGDLVAAASGALGVDVDRVLALMDKSAAVAAIEIPRARFGEYHLYPEAHDKAAAMFCRLVVAPPLQLAPDRLAAIFVSMFLSMNGYTWKYGPDLRDISDGLLSGTETELTVAAWMMPNIVDLSEPP